MGVGEICAKALPRHVGWEWRADSGACAVVARGDGEVDGQLGMEGRAQEEEQEDTQPRCHFWTK